MPRHERSVEQQEVEPGVDLLLQPSTPSRRELDEEHRGVEQAAGFNIQIIQGLEEQLRVLNTNIAEGKALLEKKKCALEEKRAELEAENLATQRGKTKEAIVQMRKEEEERMDRLPVKTLFHNVNLLGNQKSLVIDFKKIKKELAQTPDVYLKLLAFFIPPSTKTLNDIFKAQDGFFSPNSLREADYAYATGALKQFLCNELEQEQEKSRKLMADLKVSEVFLKLPEEIASIQNEHATLSTKISQEQRQVEELTQIKALYVEISEPKILSRAEIEAFKERFTAVKALEAAGTCTACLEEIEGFITASKEALIAKEKALIDEFTQSQDKLISELQNLFSKVAECKNYNDIKPIIGEIHDIDVKIKEKITREGPTLESLPSSQDKETYVNSQGRLSESLLSIKVQAGSKVLEYIDYSEACVRYIVPNLNLEEVEEQALEIQSLQQELSGLYTAAEAWFKDSEPKEVLAESGGIEGHKKQLDQDVNLCLQKLEEKRNLLVNPCITGINESPDAKDLHGIGEKLTIFAKSKQPAKAEIDELLADIKIALPKHPVAKELLNKIRVNLLDYNKMPLNRVDVESSVAVMKKGEPIQYKALVKLYSQIDRLGESDNSDMLELSKSFRDDLNRFILIKKPTKDDWVRLNDSFDARFGSVNEKKMGKHRTLWKQIVASLCTFGAYLGYKAVMAAKSYWETGHATLFPTEREIRFQQMKAVAKEELTHMKPERK